MGSLGNENGETKPPEMNLNNDCPHAETQPFDFDSQFPLSPLSGDKTVNEDDGLKYLRSTVPFDDDNVPLEDAFETQAVEFDEETQLLNFGDETQVMDDLDCMETQLLNEFDEEVSVDSGGDDTQRTEVMDDGDEVSNDVVVRGDCGQTLDKDKYTESSEQCDASSDEQMNSGSGRRFTSVRVASLRASCLAAQNAVLEGMNSEPCSIRSDRQFSDQYTVNSKGLEGVEMINQSHEEGNYDERSIGLKNGVNGRVGCVRKLFAESEGLSCSSKNADAREDLLQFPECEAPIAGLSYIDSQERGEFSQANALNFVERFVNDNLVELDDEVDLQMNHVGKPKLISSPKGMQCLAKKTIERGTETTTFEWNDFLEDEGGGDIFCRRKEEFYGAGNTAQKASTHPHKKCRVKKLDKSCKEGQSIAHSDSKLLLCKSVNDNKIVQEGQKNFTKNLFNEFDKQFHLDSSRGQLEPVSTQTGDPDVANVGFDTQMAAEAMEALFYGEEAPDQYVNRSVKGFSDGSVQKKSRKRVSSREPTVGKGVDCSDAHPVMRNSKKTKSSKESSLLLEKHSKNVQDCGKEQFLPKTKRAKSNTNEPQIAGGIDLHKMPSSRIKQRKETEASKRSQLHGTRRSTRGSSVKREHPGKDNTFIPIAHRTRQSSVMNKQVDEPPGIDCRKDRKLIKEVGFLQENRTGSTDDKLSEVSNAKGELSNLGSNQSRECGPVKSSNNDQSHLELTARGNGNLAWSHPKRRRSHIKFSVDIGESDNLGAQSKRFVHEEDNEQSIAVLKRSRSSTRSTCTPSTIKRKTPSSVSTCPDLHSADQTSEGKVPQRSSDKQGSGDDLLNYNSTETNVRKRSKSITGPEPVKAAKHLDGKYDAVFSPIAESSTVNVTLHKSPKEKSNLPGSVCTTPANCSTPTNAASPVCMGEEYIKQSCKKNLSKSLLMKELRSLSTTKPEPISPLKDLRKRRDLTNVRVLFSNHLDEDIIKQQKKIMARLGISEASSILDATHFITDKFVRTRNMLEAIASGKPVVTHLWLESIGQVNIHIDEEAYILRDIKKERELGFCMPASLARARKRPLLQDRRVLITPNTKPGKNTLTHLVTAVCGQAIERIGRSAMKDDKVLDDLLILSCEEDYEICVPFLEKGAAVYSAELLLNGIVTQKLDYERHRLFTEYVRRTRSTLWLRKNDKFLPVAKNN